MNDISTGRDREAALITTVLAIPCAFACAGSVIPGLDDAITVALLVIGALIVLVGATRLVARRVRERREDRADALTAAIWRHQHSSSTTVAATAVATASSVVA
jgi:adenylate kinase